MQPGKVAFVMDAPDLFSQMALDLHAEPTSADTVEKIVQYARLATTCDESGILLVHSRHRVETAAATAPLVSAAHDLQIRFDEGPCLDAIDGAGTYVVGETATDERWPQWGPAVAELGIHSALGVRLATRNRRYGSLNFYGRRPGMFSDEDVAVAEAFARHAAVAFANTREEEGLITAIDARKVIGQAQGIVMERYGLDTDRAFEFLRRLSQQDNIKLRAVAERIVHQHENDIRRPHEA